MTPMPSWRAMQLVSELARPPLLPVIPSGLLLSALSPCGTFISRDAPELVIAD